MADFDRLADELAPAVNGEDLAAAANLVTDHARTAQRRHLANLFGEDGAT